MLPRTATNRRSGRAAAVCPTCRVAATPRPCPTCRAAATPRRCPPCPPPARRPGRVGPLVAPIRPCPVAAPVPPCPVAAPAPPCPPACRRARPVPAVRNGRRTGCGRRAGPITPTPPYRRSTVLRPHPPVGRHPPVAGGPRRPPARRLAVRRRPGRRRRRPVARRHLRGGAPGQTAGVDRSRCRPAPVTTSTIRPRPPDPGRRGALRPASEGVPPTGRRPPGPACRTPPGRRAWSVATGGRPVPCEVRHVRTAVRRVPCGARAVRRVPCGARRAPTGGPTRPEERHAPAACPAIRWADPSPPGQPRAASPWAQPVPTARSPVRVRPAPGPVRPHRGGHRRAPTGRHRPSGAPAHRPRPRRPPAAQSPAPDPVPTSGRPHGRPRRTGNRCVPAPRARQRCHRRRVPGRSRSSRGPRRSCPRRTPRRRVPRPAR
ncbi:hypothetical protein GA0070616_4775 [Micromonospora nigra]|uniref:Uncharacterized protein n=1 Tax=Micromonospora nigra TaxID=145857 RepID=A0A1C6SX31_9ACTN|nr:hypothetical protein GA0070616_4775 [Micromonospora nigra]